MFEGVRGTTVPVVTRLYITAFEGAANRQGPVVGASRLTACEVDVAHAGPETGEQRARSSARTRTLILRRAIDGN